MEWILVLWLQVQAPIVDRPDRWVNYPYVPLEKIAGTARTHVCTEATVVYVRRMRDGDWHITLFAVRGEREFKVVAEIIPAIPLPPPRKGDWVRVCGITRFDEQHNWPEIHPVEFLEIKERK